MEKILITGGTDGIGKALALNLAKSGVQVYVVGSTEAKGQAMEDKSSNIHFLKANLSLVSENRRLVKYMEEEVGGLDQLILCAASLKPQPEYRETDEGNEFTFALYYLSRYILSYGLAPLLEKSEHPVIINVAAPGMKTKLHADDFQMKQKYDGQEAQFHGSRLNDLLAVAFSEQYGQKIKYILFNPMAARTSGAKKMSGGNWFMELYYKMLGKEPEELAEIILEDAAKTVAPGLAAYKLKKPVDLQMETFDRGNADKLRKYTESITQNE